MKTPSDDVQALRLAGELMLMAQRSNAGDWYGFFMEILDGDKLREWLGAHGYRGPLHVDQVRRLLEIGARTYSVTQKSLYVRSDD